MGGSNHYIRIFRTTHMTVQMTSTSFNKQK